MSNLRRSRRSRFVALLVGAACVAWVAIATSGPARYTDGHAKMVAMPRAATAELQVAYDKDSALARKLLRYRDMYGTFSVPILRPNYIITPLFAGETKYLWPAATSCTLKVGGVLHEVRPDGTGRILVIYAPPANNNPKKSDCFGGEVALLAYEQIVALSER